MAPPPKPLRTRPSPAVAWPDGYRFLRLDSPEWRFINPIFLMCDSVPSKVNFSVSVFMKLFRLSMPEYFNIPRVFRIHARTFRLLAVGQKQHEYSANSRRSTHFGGAIMKTNQLSLKIKQFNRRIEGRIIPPLILWLLGVPGMVVIIRRS